MGKKINPQLKRRFEVIDRMGVHQICDCLDKFEELGIGYGSSVSHTKNQTSLKDLTVTMAAFLTVLDDESIFQREIEVETIA